MSDTFTFFFGLILGVSACFVVTVSIIFHTAQDNLDLKSYAIKKGYAEYVISQNSGEIVFRWKEQLKLCGIGV